SQLSSDDFIRAVKEGFQNYTVFEGRTSRAYFWYWIAFVVAVNLLALLLDTLLGSVVIKAFVVMGLLIPNITIMVRRLHDVGKSGWWMWVGLIPVLGIVIL